MGTLRRASIAVFLATALSCTDGPAAPVPQRAVIVTPETVSLLPLETAALVGRVESADGRVVATPILSWRSIDTAIVSVTPAGLVAARAYVGAAARYGIVVVSAPSADPDTVLVEVRPWPVARVVAAVDSVIVTPGRFTTLTARVEALDSTALTERNVLWISHDTTVATVNADGIVLALFYVGPDERTARVSATFGQLADTTLIVVRPHAVGSVAVFPATETLRPNRTVQPDAILRDSTGLFLTGRPVTWSSSDTVIATVSATGLVLARRAGSAVITAQSGSASAQMLLTVVHPVTAVRLTPRLSTVWIGRQQTFSVTLTDSVDVLLTDRLVTWISSDPSRATVSPAGIVTALSEGLVTITATAEGISAGASVDVFVEPLAAITITFDDAWRGVLQHAAPLLDSLRLRANVGWITKVDWSGVMTPDELRVLQAAGWSVVSHSMTHAYLTRISLDSAAQELSGSRAQIASLGFDPRVFIAPYVAYDDDILAASAAAGYSYTRCCVQEVWNTDTLLSWPIRNGAQHRLAGVDVTNYDGQVTTYNFHTASGRQALRALLLDVVARRKFIDVFFHDIVAADVPDLRLTLEILAEFRPYLITYGMLP